MRPPEEVAPPTEKLEEELAQNAETLIKEAEELISKAKEFIEKEKEKKAEIEVAFERASRVKGIYAGAGYNQAYFKNLLGETELNGIVIDVKESYGINLPYSLKNFIQELHQKDVWAIARIVVFRDSSLAEEKPEWYLGISTSTQATSSDSLWRDNARQYWLDPQNEEVQDYIIEFSKKVIDFGFDELQFDYIRYPDDYSSPVEKCKVIGGFFSKISESLKNYQPTIILSVDLFGYVATQFNSDLIGQRLIDAGKHFDYLSFMLYPSHFYGGFWTKEVQYSYPEAVEHPYDVVYYSVLTAQNYLSYFDNKAEIRPWLQDFNLGVDSARGVVYDAEKIRAQIDAAENATSSGWLLWNSSNIYTEEALK